MSDHSRETPGSQPSGEPLPAPPGEPAAPPVAPPAATPAAPPVDEPISPPFTGPMPGGRRRIDRVLAEDYLTGLTERELADVRRLRKEAEQEEADLSYVRRLLQGRTDIVEAELARRTAQGGSAADRGIVEHLAEILADAGRNDRGLGRFLTVEPSRVDEHRRAVEQVVVDVGISDVEARTDDELRAAVGRLRGYEQEVSAARRRVQQVMDACTAEIGRRYREGAAHVEDLLPEE